mgnify:CR=1 FL=1
MKTAKVTYRTPEGRVFRTIAPFENTLSYMNENYYDIEILSIRPSIKTTYVTVVNKQVR